MMGPDVKTKLKIEWESMTRRIYDEAQDDLKGNMVYEYDFGYINPGLYNYVLDAKNFTSGVYIYSIGTSYGFNAHKQMILIK